MIDPTGEILVPPRPELRACVVIPARNEAANLPATLDALRLQRDQNGERLDHRAYEVIVLANNCTDSTSTIAQGFAERHAAELTVHVVTHDWPANLAHVGTARRWLMDQACLRLEQVEQPHGLIASTDADTRAGPRWIVASLAELAAGAAAVAGMIGVDPAELRRAGPLIRQAYLGDLVYRRLRLELETIIDPNPLDPNPGHDWHGGASFGITPAMYRQVGGLPCLPHLEDVALAEALWRLDARFVHSARVRVRTSARLQGRTVIGFSESLNRWTSEPDRLVPNARTIEAELVLRNQIRRLFQQWTQDGSGPAPPNPELLAPLAQTLWLDVPDLRSILRDQTTFGGWVLELNQVRARSGLENQAGLIPIRIAIAQLRARVQALRRGGLAMTLA